LALKSTLFADKIGVIAEDCLKIVVFHLVFAKSLAGDEIAE
jgi:hypothetical protein